MNTSKIIGLLLLLTLFSMSSCKKKIKGCMDPKSTSYNSKATEDDGSCVYTKTLGESFGGGLIFYIDATGQHGLVAAPSDQGSSRLWLNSLIIATGATYTEVGKGQSNTNSIISMQGAGTYAASVSNDLVLGGYSDWFLPSRDELALMYTNLFTKNLGGFAYARYWSSSEVNINDAICIEFNSGVVSPINKNTAISVRSVRAF